MLFYSYITQLIDCPSPRTIHFHLRPPTSMSPEFSEMPQQGQIQFSGAVDDTMSWGSIPFLPCFFITSPDNRLGAESGYQKVVKQNMLSPICVCVFLGHSK